MATNIKKVKVPMKAQLTMAQYEALTDIIEYKTYDIIDYPQDGATNEQMTFALTCKRLFPADTVVTFSGATDNTYTNGHLYQIQVDTSGTKSWKDITQTITTTQTISSASTAEEIPSAKAVYDYVNSAITTVLNTEV